MVLLKELGILGWCEPRVTERVVNCATPENGYEIQGQNCVHYFREVKYHPGSTTGI